MGIECSKSFSILNFASNMKEKLKEQTRDEIIARSA